MKKRAVFLMFTILISCTKNLDSESLPTQPYLLVLGVAQDAGYPQIACQKDCCKRVYQNSENKRLVSSIAIIDPISNQSWLFDATPDFTQ